MPTALGLMSGTSLDGIDAAILVTDGERIEAFGPALTLPYEPAFRDRLRACLGTRGDGAVERELTIRHALAVKRLAADWGRPVDIVGFHGQTVLHRPKDGITVQMGDGALLARETGIPVVGDFRSADVAAGGEGAPLVPLYHAALARDLDKPLAVLNLGGVGNVTFLGRDGGLLAFDTGPGNALLDDWVRTHKGMPCDVDGKLALAGRADAFTLVDLFAHPFFRRKPPKSLDRDDLAAALDTVARLSPADGAATLTGFTAGAVGRAVEWLPEEPRRWLVCGGGRRNPALMAALVQALEVPVDPVEAVGWQGDALEAQAFAFLAVRSTRGLALSLPTTTGVARPMPGGTLYRP
ncbi:MAG: anhydro-N-acetylmuramic acid kinase [Magnetospirillum sp. WYHS-4]